MFLAATYVASYDEGNTHYYEVAVENVPEHILLLRCDPAVITALPTAWPESGVWNQTNDGNVAQKTTGEGSEQTPVPGRYWVDLSIK